jgi:hypothetical protein
MTGSLDGSLREGANPTPARHRGSPSRAFLGRLMLAHFIAYPISVITAVGAMPVAVYVRQRSILEARAVGARWSMVSDALAKYRVSPTEAAQVQIVLDFVLLVTVAFFVLVHLAVLPWAIGAARAGARAQLPDGAGAPTGNVTAQKRAAGFRVFVGITAATLILVAISGTAGWLWLLLQ